MATFEDFQKLDIRVGKIIEVEDFPEARKPSYKLKIDLGHEIGVKKSCAQVLQNYKADELVGKQVLCVVNFPPPNLIQRGRAGRPLALPVPMWQMPGLFPLPP